MCVRKRNCWLRARRRNFSWDFRDYPISGQMGTRDQTIYLLDTQPHRESATLRPNGASKRDFQFSLFTRMAEFAMWARGSFGRQRRLIHWLAVSVIHLFLGVLCICLCQRDVISLGRKHHWNTAQAKQKTSVKTRRIVCLMWVRTTQYKITCKQRQQTEKIGQGRSEIARVLFLIHTFISRTRNTINTIYELAHFFAFSAAAKKTEINILRRWWDERWEERKKMGIKLCCGRVGVVINSSSNWILERWDAFGMRK